MKMLNGFNLCLRTSSSLKTSHALAIYPNCDVMFENALHFLKKGLENSEVTALLSYCCNETTLAAMRHLCARNCLETMQNPGSVLLGDVAGLYFIGTQGKARNERALCSWAELIGEAVRFGKGLKVFVDMQELFNRNIVEELIKWESAVDSAVQSYGESAFALQIMKGCLEPEVVRLGLESFRMLQECHNCIYIVPR